MMKITPIELKPSTREFYVRTLTVLNQAEVPYLVGGAFALAKHAGIERYTKDLDVFLRRNDRDRILRTLAAAGYRTEVSFPHWLAKAYSEEGFVDIIYSSGNGVTEVDEEWFAHASDAEVLGVQVKLCPAEEMIWSKSYVQERERFDGADIAHLIRCGGEVLDWGRLLRRFGDHWRVLLAYLITFGFIYPAEREKVPSSVLRELCNRLFRDLEEPAPRTQVCFGTLLSREQYLPDIGLWGYRDARLRPLGPMSPEEVEHWTAAIAAAKP